MDDLNAQKLEALRQQVLDLGADRAAVVPVEEFVFDPSYRRICETKTCGMYGKCWMCPPDIPAEDEMIAEARTFQQAVIYQTVSEIEDSLDVEGMLEAGNRHNALAQEVGKTLRAGGWSPFLHLGAGACRFCAVCARASGKPCPFPDNALHSLEGYCIDVASLAEKSGMRYMNGVNTVTYFGAILLK